MPSHTRHQILTLAIVCAGSLPSARGQCGNVNSAYGINSHAPAGSSLSQIFNEVQAGGLGWVRIDFNWFAIETSQDVFNWSLYDAIASAAEARGIRIYATLAYTPQWATSGAQQTGVPNSSADWYDFCLRAAQRYPSIQHWGMWNEANLDQFWAGTRQQYIDIILKNGADAIHATNPLAKVCGPEMAHLTSGDQDWYYWLQDSINQAGVKLDIVTHHLYDGDGNTDVKTKLNATTTFGTSPNNWTIIAPSVREVLVNTGWFGKPFWLTETGWGSDTVGESTQAIYYNGLLTDWFTGITGQTWINKVFFYEVQDDPTVGVTKWGILRSDFTEKPSYTSYKNFITAHPPPLAAPCKAGTPIPASGAANVVLTQMLSWTPGLGASSHAIYFGTTSPGTFKGNQSSTTYDPGALSAGTTYYWRIDEINAAGTTIGDLWSFATIPPSPPTKATNPSPANLATGVNTASQLSWSAGSNVSAHTVYFGTSSPGSLQGNQLGTTYDPGVLTPFTTYFWRIDESGPGGTTTGDAWRFTTSGQLGDLDTDGDVDQSDFGLFQRCFSGSGVLAGAGCAAANFDVDGDVDQTDFAGFLNCLKGSDVPPGC